MTPTRKSPRARLDDVEKVFFALAHPARRQILLTVHLWGGWMRAGEVAARFRHSWPTTTRHLNVLVDAGLLAHSRSGRSSTYRLNRGRLDVASAWLDWFDKPSASRRMTERATKTIVA